jgi:class 3 adenylate cyclase
MSTNASTADDFESGFATVAFVDLAGFSAITDVYGDASAIAVLGRFEELVREALGGLGPPIKWIGDEAMFGFPDPATALQCSDVCFQRADPSLGFHNKDRAKPRPSTPQSERSLWFHSQHRSTHRRVRVARAIVGDPPGRQYRDSIGNCCPGHREG